MTRLLANRHARGVVLALAVGVFLALVGAFDTGGAPLWLRLVYWSLLMLIGSLAGLGVSLATEMGVWLDNRPWLQGAVIVAVLTPVLTLAVWAITMSFFCTGCGYPIGRIGQYFVPVLVITLALTILNYVIQKTPVETHAAVSAAASPPRFLERLPPKLRGADLYAVEAEDHYLRLHTSKGQDLILMRLSDAVAELEGIEGARTHRSWWVAKGAVTGARRGDGRATLTLTNGVEAPVSRAYAGALRAAGWY